MNVKENNEMLNTLCIEKISQEFLEKVLNKMTSKSQDTTFCEMNKHYMSDILLRKLDIIKIMKINPDDYLFNCSVIFKSIKYITENTLFRNPSIPYHITYDDDLMSIRIFREYSLAYCNKNFDTVINKKYQEYENTKKYAMKTLEKSNLNIDVIGRISEYLYGNNFYYPKELKENIPYFFTTE